MSPEEADALKLDGANIVRVKYKDGAYKNFPASEKIAVREFIKNNPTVYCSTHTPLGYENLETKKVVDLDKMPAPIPPKEITAKAATGKYVCSICGYVYDPAENGGVAFEDLPADWKCLRCKQSKDKFNRA